MSGEYENPHPDTTFPCSTCGQESEIEGFCPSCDGVDGDSGAVIAMDSGSSDNQHRSTRTRAVIELLVGIVFIIAVVWVLGEAPLGSAHHPGLPATRPLLPLVLGLLVAARYRHLRGASVKGIGWALQILGVLLALIYLPARFSGRGLEPVDAVGIPVLFMVCLFYGFFFKHR